MLRSTGSTYKAPWGVTFIIVPKKWICGRKNQSLKVSGKLQQKQDSSLVCYQYAMIRQKKFPQQNKQNSRRKIR